MGMFDYVEIHETHLDIEPDGKWQTKHRPQPAMETFRIDEDGRLLLEEVETHTVPEEERRGYNEEIGGFESPIDEWMGSIRRERTGWEHWDDFHGMFEFHSSVDGEYRRFHAKYTDGELEEIIEVTDASN